MNLVLIGLRGSGKSTLGRLLAARLDWPLLDTDTLIQDRAGKTIREIFAQNGEPVFRRLEAEVVQDCAARDRVIIACGGGAVLNSQSVAALRQNGLVVHLSADPEELYRRISGDPSTGQTRPALLAGAKSGLEEMKELARSRAAAYAQARHVEVQVGERAPEEIAAEIAAVMEARGTLPA